MMIASTWCGRSERHSSHWWRDPIDEVTRHKGCNGCGRDCDHPGRRCPAIPCPDCGKFSAHSWATEPTYTPNGFDQRWGGICRTHGEWSESA